MPSEPPAGVESQPSSRSKSEGTTQSSDDIQKLLIETTRTQLAAMSAVTKFWAGWAVAAESYTRGIGNELTRIGEENINSTDSIGRVTDLTREYLRTIVELPTEAVRQFSEEIVSVSRPQVKRSRNARTKA